MINKDHLRKLEYPILFVFLGSWLVIYILTRIFVEMYTDHTPSVVWIWLLIICAPLSLYAALRAAFSQGVKWYRSIGYIFVFTIGTLFCGQYIVIKGDILLSVFTKTPVSIEADVINVKKVIKRKLGFDHTAITLQFGGKVVELEARPRTYFYLKDKKTLHITAGTSFIGNTYVTSSGVTGREKQIARWLHLKDWAYRFRLLWAILLCMIIGSIIKAKYFPEKPGAKPVPKIGFWKLLGILMAILMAIGFVLYTGLLIYVKFFVTR